MLRTENKELYPTPAAVIEKMLSKINLVRQMNILEPSAGLGNIVKAIKSADHYACVNIDAIEPENEYHPLLKSAGAAIVGDDFLTFQSYKIYDAIIMNPPFSNGDRHLLKAIDMMKNGGKIVCLLNAETIRNPYSVYRKDLVAKLEKYHAEIEYLGAAFKDSERPTDVEIAMVYINIPENYNSSIMDNLKKEKEQEFAEMEETAISDRKLDVFTAMVEQYQLEVESTLRLIDEFYTISVLNQDKKILDLSFTHDGRSFTIDKGDLSRFKNEAIKRVRTKYWDILLNRDEIVGNMTEETKRDYGKKIESFREIEFNLSNIKQIQIDILNNLVSGVENAILKFFDDATYTHSYHSEYSNTIHYYNGWCSNKIGIVDKKVVIPIKCWSQYTGRFEPREALFKIRDIHKVFRYFDDNPDLSGPDRILDIISEAEKNEQVKNVEFEYFTVDFFKKGTIHVKFKRPDLVKRLNIYCGKKKNGLPPSYGKKRYKDMTAEEKRIIDEFEGKASYEEVMDNPSAYILETTSMLALTTSA